MAQKAAISEPKVNSTWDRLEEFVREHVQRFIQALLEVAASTAHKLKGSQLLPDVYAGECTTSMASRGG